MSNIYYIITKIFYITIFLNLTKSFNCDFNSIGLQADHIDLGNFDTGSLFTLYLTFRHQSASGEQGRSC